MTKILRKELVLVAVFVAVVALTATGAFTSVTAERTAEVDVAGDSNAYLQLQSYDGPNGHYAKTTGGTLELDLSDSNQGTPSGAGVNPNATTTIDNVFNITNQGTQSVFVNINDDSGDVRFYNSANESLEDGTQEIAPGETIQVGLSVDTTGTDEFDDLTEVTIVADQTDEVDTPS
jgi:hypothetical protein